MRDYMKALQMQFTNPSHRAQELEQEINILHERLADCLGKPERKMLLQLADLEDDLQEQVGLDSFISGFRLAGGIHHELMEQPPYSFEADEERRACERLERKGD